jgi:phospholipid transport system substrate-binding protein
MLGLVLPLQAEPAQPVSPRADMTQVVNQLVDIVEAFPGDDTRTQRRAKLREVIEPRFDFTEMSRRCLGQAWNDISPAEQEEFNRVFSELLAKTYLNRIETVRRGMVRVTGEDIEGNKALVKTMVKVKGEEFPIDYKLLRRDNRWRVYDVLIENIGLVANYRNEFAGIIRQDKFSGLMTKLKEKVNNEEKG